LTASNLVNAACQVRKFPVQELKQAVSGMREEIAELKTLLQQALGGGGSDGGGNGGRRGIISSTLSSVGGYMPHIPGISSPK